MRDGYLPSSDPENDKSSNWDIPSMDDGPQSKKDELRMRKEEAENESSTSIILKGNVFLKNTYKGLGPGSRSMQAIVDRIGQEIEDERNGIKPESTSEDTTVEQTCGVYSKVYRDQWMRRHM